MLDSNVPEKQSRIYKLAIVFTLQDVNILASTALFDETQFVGRTSYPDTLPLLDSTDVSLADDMTVVAQATRGQLQEVEVKRVVEYSVASRITGIIY